MQNMHATFLICDQSDQNQAYDSACTSDVMRLKCDKVTFSIIILDKKLHMTALTH